MTDQQLRSVMRFAHRLVFAACEAAFDGANPLHVARRNRVGAALREAEEIIDELPLPNGIDDLDVEWTLQHNENHMFLGQDPCNPSMPTYFKAADNALVFRFPSDGEARNHARSMNLWALLTPVPCRRAD